MKRLLFKCALGLMLSATAATATPLLYVDAAPNVYGSSNYAPWYAAAQAGVLGGTFQNMGNSVDPSNAGTTNFELEDAVVYSFGDLGRRLSFIYYVPGETIASLTQANFGIAMSYDWDGVTYDFYADHYGQTWQTPTSWVETSAGVFGVAGFAWWGAYNVNTQAALDADLVDWRPYQGNITFSVRMDDSTTSLTAVHTPPASVPEPATFGLLGLGLAALVAHRRRL